MKKKLFRLAAFAAAFVLMLTSAVYADELPEEEGTEAVVSETVELSIDNLHKYKDMSASYSEGYVPTVRDGKAIIVFPLIAKGEVADKKVNVIPDLGGTSSSPFVYKNYNLTFTEEEIIPEGQTETVSVYMVRLELDLSSDRINGVYPVGITVSGKSTTDIQFSDRFSVYVTIKDGKNPNESKEPEDATSPVLYIDSYRIEPETVVAGEEFSVIVNLKNTGSSKTIKNLRIRPGSSDDVTCLEASDTIFVKKIASEEMATVTLLYKADSFTPVGKYHIDLDMQYDGGSASGDITVPITQAMRVTPVFPGSNTSVNAGDTFSLNFQAINMGAGEVYNVRFVIDVPGLIPSGDAYIGNIAPNSEGSASVKVFAGAKSMTDTLHEGEEDYGYTHGPVTMIYEDENGNEYTELGNISTTIEKLDIGGETAPEETKPETQWIVAIIAGAALCAGAVAAVLLIKKKKSGK